MLSQLGQITVGIIDNIMIGRLGTEELAAASFANNIFNLAIIFGMGFAYIITPLVGASVGNRSSIKSAVIFKNGFAANGTMGILLTVILFLLSLLFKFMGQDETIITPATDYFLLLNITTLPLMLFYSFKQFAEGTGDTRTGMLIVLSANFVNVAGNNMFMFGKFGISPQGLNGAAIGTIIARFYMLLAFFLLFRFKNKYIRFLRGYSRVRINLDHIGQIAKKGLLLGIQMVTEACAFGLAGIMIGWMGQTGLAAYQVAISLSTLGFMVYQGMGVATTILVSQCVGIKAYNNVQEVAILASKMIVPISLIMTVFFIICRSWLPMVFSTDHQVQQMASLFLIVLGIYQLPDALQIIFSSAVRGLADVKLPTYLTILSHIFIALPTSYLFAFLLKFHQIGIWFGFPLALTISFFFMFLRFRYLLKRIDKSM